MRKQSLTLCLLIGIILFESAIYADAYSVTYTAPNPSIELFIGNSPAPAFYTYTYNSFLQDFALNSITAATLNVYLKDDVDTSDDKFTLTADGNTITSKGGGFKMLDSWTSYGGSVLPYIADDSLIALILRDGNNNDFYFSKFELTITGAPPAVVPIPAAAWMLGSGLVGLVAIRRKKMR